MLLGFVSYLLDFLVVFLHSQNSKTYSTDCLFLVFFLTIMWALSALVVNFPTDEALVAPFPSAGTHRNFSSSMEPAELYLNLLFFY